MLKSRFFRLVLIVIVLFVSFKFRIRNFWSYPPVYETFDELASVWLGQSLIKTGVPTSWSFHPYYGKGIPSGARLYLEDFRITIPGTDFKKLPKPLLLTQEVEINGYKSHFNFVTPDLEQPPLGSVLISLSSVLSKVNNFATDVKEIRLPFIYLGVLSVILVWYLAKLVFGDAVSLIASSVYATVPTIVFGSRLALPENILVIFFLLEIIFLELYRKKEKSSFFILALIISFLAPLIKLFGVAMPLTGFIYFWLVIKDRRKSVVFLLGLILSLLTYCLYGFAIDKNTFLMGLDYQSQRFFSGPNTFLIKILIPRVTKIFLDGWIFFAWISFFILVFEENFKKYFSLILPVVSYLFVLILFGGEDYGWYRFPLYPFLIISSGVVINAMIKKAKRLPFLIFLVTAIASSFYWGLNIYNWTPYLNYFRLALVMVIGILIPRKLVPAAMVIILIIGLFLNTRVINYSQGIWERLGDKSSLIIGR